ncbi:uncharacterized protein KQ657_005191 [Scheffersomyces spartinae]|uniref:Ammonium transporter n=1 Tax=Scheffersomyces spartinae TaxID=45513 RepID=A0A9P7V9T4_9ASCO|nr:uncharacterized protein KQ657_005191 [Scheffersomyces spartinae]KAG7193992.1 hypothetical protein KQ657_005191 [Scheffersomyces spartinae]
MIGTVASILFKRASIEKWNEFDQTLMLVFTIAQSVIWIMIPGLAFLYSGLARRKSALSMIWIVIASSFVGIFQWYFWGYSLAFSASSNSFIGNLEYFGFKGLLASPSDETYPLLAFSLFQMEFMLVTLAIIAGPCVAERGRFLPAIVFFFCWATIVYCPVVYWIWGGGWAAKWGVLDYAGGGPVEILSGVTALVYSYFLGRRNETLMINYRPHNISTIFTGTALLYVGWLFFNGFSAGNASLKVPYSMMNSHLSAAFGALTWCLLDYRLEKKWSMVAVCSGCISGLVAATPSSGIIPLWASVILGIVTGIVSNFSTQIKNLMRIDESLDAFAEHGIAGMVGLIFNGIFGSRTVIGYDGVTDHAGGWIDHNWKQLYKQICYILAVTAYGAGVSAVICIVLNYIPGLYLRVDYEGEERGIDEDQIGEFAYDYVEVRRDYLSWANPQPASTYSAGEKGEELEHPVEDDDHAVGSSNASVHEPIIHEKNVASA